MREDGFTLLEVLVAMTVLALLTVMVMEATRLMAGVRLAVTGVADEDHQAELGVVRRVISGALPLSPRDAGFAGNATDLAFIGGPPAASQPPGLYRHRLEFGEGQLRYEWRALEGEQAGDVRLLAVPEGASWSYLGADRVWRDEWRSRAALPRLVRLRLGDGAEVVAAPMADWPVLERAPP